MTEWYKDLVGSSMTYRRRGVTDEDTAKTIRRTRRNIEEEIELSRTADKRTQILYLSEMYAYVSRTSYYRSVKGVISFGRLGSLVREYLSDCSVDERCEQLLSSLKTKPDRAIKLKAVRYFLKNYPTRKSKFEEVLTKNELLEVLL